MYMTNNNRAIICLSVGNDRLWASKTTERMKEYCSKIKSDFYLIDSDIGKEIAIIKDMKPKPGRKNKYPYALKAYVIWKYLQKYQKVLYLDDSCCISKTATNIFDIVPEGYCAYANDDKFDISFKDIKRYINNSTNIKFDSSLYMNSGIMIFDQIHKDIFCPNNILKHKDLLFSMQPNQTLTYYLLQLYQAKTFLLPSSFHTVPGKGIISDKERRQIKTVKGFINDDIHFYHITGLYKNRYDVISDLLENV